MCKDPKFKLTISASRVGEHYMRGCERYTAYSLMADPGAVGWDERDRRHTALQEAGHVWEWDVLVKLEDQGIHCYAEGEYSHNSRKKEPHFRVTDFAKMRLLCDVYSGSRGEDAVAYADLSAEKTIEIMKDPGKYLLGYEEGNPVYIYQATIECPEGFKREFLLNSKEHADLMDKIFDGSDEDIKAAWSICKPDLIRVEKGEDGEAVFSVVDIKHAKHARMGHKVQVAIYVELLSFLLAEKGISGRVSRDEAYLWNFKMDEPHAFDLHSVKPWVDDFFAKVLPDTIAVMKSCLAAGNNALFNERFKACPGFQCDWCDNFNCCTSWQQAHESVTLMPYMSVHAQKYLRAHNVPLDIKGFEGYLSDPGREERLKEGCLGLKRVLRQKADNIAALEEKCAGNAAGARVREGISYLGMPSSENVRVIITAQRDEVSDSIYAAGISVREFTGLSLEAEGFETEEFVTSNNNTMYTHRWLLMAKDPALTEDVIRGLFEGIYAVLKACGEYNAEKERTYEDRLSVQGYVMDRYEYKNLEDALLNELLEGAGTYDMDYRTRLLEVLFWLQGERAVTDVEEQAYSFGMEFPMVVINDAVRSIFSIPAFICYDMKSVCDALLSKTEDESVFLSIEKYHHRLSNTIKSDIINEVWSTKSVDPEKALNGLSMHLKVRMDLEGRLVDRIRDLAKDSLKRGAQKYFLSSANNVMNTRTAKLWTEYQYEELLKYRDVRNIRMSDPEDMASEGKIMKLSLLEKTSVSKNAFYPRRREEDGYFLKFRLENSDSCFLDGYFRGILIRAGDEGILSELRRMSKSMEDMNLPHSLYGPEYPCQNIYSADNISIVQKGNDRIVNLECYAGSEPFKPGTEYYLMESYKNMQGNKVESALVYENESTRHLLDPEEFYADATVIDAGGEKRTATENDLEECLSYRPEDGADFTSSQLAAFEQLFLKNITLLLGPPGSGKTDFIARAVVTLCRYYKSKGRNLSVLLSANSHSAVNNILEKLEEKAGDSLSLYKMNKWGDSDEDAIKGIKLVDDFGKSDENTRNVFSFSDDRPFAAGSTCWQAKKMVDSYNKYNSGQAFAGYDLIVIDEASQMRAMDALISLETGLDNPDTRYLIVGDEDQLPPIIQGKYDASGQEVDIYGSIFRLYYDSSIVFGLDYMVQLEEQFRMNEILCRYSAKSIYDRGILPGSLRSGYHAFDFGRVTEGGVAAQKLKLAGRPGDAMIEKLTDPEYPMVVCRIHSGDAFEKRDEEIKLVTQLVSALFKNMCVPGTDKPYAGEESFWGGSNTEGGAGIISPHHEQINRLKDAISKDLGMDREKIFIGTVDKLQGRQRETVIVSYGVTDPEKAAGEMEFIYSRNRLNVAITRGKKKVICILSDTLLDRSVETLNVDDDDTLKGIDFMTGLIEYMETPEADEEADIDRDVSLGSVKMDIFRKRIRQ